MLVLRNCKFIRELTEGVDFDCGDLVLENGLIKEICPCGAVIDGDYEEFDAEGKTVMPGLINAHVHLFMVRDLDYAMPFDSIPRRTMDCYKFAKFLLENGYTTVRDCGDDNNFPANTLRDAVKCGEIVGPNILTSGPTICPSEPGAEPFGFMTAFADTPEEVRKIARLNFQKQVDFLKVYGTGSMFTGSGEPGKRIMEEDEMLAAVQVAERKGSYTAIHCHGTEAIETALKCGISTIEHATFIGEEACRMLDGREDAGIVPTVSLVGGWVAQESIPARPRQIIDEMISCLKNACENHDVLIGWGTDIPMNTQAKEPGMEFRLRKELLGYSNLDMLKQATINSAKLIRMQDQVGTIRRGKMADLIVVDGDPVEDISLLYGAPAHVIKSGVFVK